MMKTLNVIGKIAAGTLALVCGLAVSHAGTVTLNASDSVGTSSFNTAGHWVNAQAPSAANDYDTAGFFMRSPGDSVTNYVFQGNSLTLNVQNTSGGNNGSLLEKFGPGAGSVRWLTINNLTNHDQAMIRSGGTAGALIHIQGNGYTMLGNSCLQADQCIWVIDSPLIGADNVIVTNNANNNPDHVSFTGTNSAFTGSWYLMNGGNGGWSCELDSVYSLPGNPSTFNPGQITFLANGQLRDTAGCALTNSNSGITLAANGNINTSVTTLIGEPITDLTNGVSSLSRLTASGTGTLILSNANNNYSGGTVISAGTLQLGVDNAIPSGAGDVTDNGSIDLNGHNLTINGLNGAGGIDTLSGGTVTLTIGANGDSGNFTGSIANSAGTLSIVKKGAGTQNLTGACSYSGTTVLAGGTLNFNPTTFVPATAGATVVSNSVIGVDATSGVSLGLGSLTLADNATNNITYGTLSANPTVPAITLSGSLTAPGTNVVIGFTALGLKTGSFPLIKYTGSALPDVSNFTLAAPLGVVGTLVNNTANRSVDVNITAVPDVVTWNGVGGTNWDLTTVNWAVVGGGNFVAFRQGDSVTFDDTLTNDFVNPQPTNVNLTAQFFAYPIPGLTVNSSLPYTFSGPGGLTGTAPLLMSGSGSLSLLTSNSFTGGVTVSGGGTLIITNDSALGASSGNLTLNGGTLQMNGAVTNSRAIAMPAVSTIGVATNVTSSLGGVISGAAGSLNLIGNGTLILTAKETLTGDLFMHSGNVIIDSGGSITNGSYHDVGQSGTDNATLTIRGTGNFGTTSDFNAGDIDSSVGTVNIQGSGNLTANQIFVGSANAAGSTASGTFNQSGGTVTEVSGAVGAFSIGGRNSNLGVGVYNMSGGTLTAFAGMRIGGAGTGTLNQSGGTINARQGINIARLSGSIGTNNLNGGTLATFNVSSSTGQNAVFNFNGGTLQAAFNPPNATWFSGTIQANVLAGGAIIDTTSTNNVTIATPLLAGSPSGGLTKKGSATLTLTGVNTFTGPITNTAGTLVLNSASTYPGAVVVNGGTVQATTANTITGPTIVTNGSVFGVSQLGSATMSLSSLTLNGAASGTGAIIAISPTAANNPTVPVVNCGALTLNGTNSIALSTGSTGTLALIKYTGSLPVTGSLTNLVLPQGSAGFISNDIPNSTIYAVVTAVGDGLVWAGGGSTAANTWNINTTTNWTVGGVPTTYHQIISPGDLVTFNDSGSGTAIVSTAVSPTSLTISNNAKAYTFSGPGTISGPTGIKKLGTGTAVLNLTNDNFSGDVVISNGVLQVGTATTIPAGANLTLGSAGTLKFAFDQTEGELNGSGTLDYTGGNPALLTFPSSGVDFWNGTIKDEGAGGLALTKSGSGTLWLGGTNRFANGTAFTVTNSFNAGTTILTNGAVVTSPFLVTSIANTTGSSASMIVDGGMLVVSNNILAIGYATGATASMTVNNGTVNHGGPVSAAFGGPNNNNIIVGGGGSTGTLTVNGGQVLNTQELILGQNATGSGTLNLNGGLVQASEVVPNNIPATSVANFNGGTLQAVTNSGDFLQVNSMVMSNGFVLDDGGYSVTIATAPLVAGDAFNGGFIKTGSGAVYIDNTGSSYTGLTVVTNGLLAGTGSVPGAVLVAPNGRIGGGDTNGTGTFTAGGDITIQGGAIMRINKDSSANDVVATSGKITYGGTLAVNNLSTVALSVGDSFTLFTSGSHAGNFSTIAGSPGAGMGYSFDPTSGKLSVVVSTIATNPTNITVSASGGSMTLTWPADHQGWTLQSNAVGLTSSGTWFDYPASTGSRDTTSVTIPVTGTTNSVYFRLKSP